MSSPQRDEAVTRRPPGGFAGPEAQPALAENAVEEARPQVVDPGLSGQATTSRAGQVKAVAMHFPFLENRTRRLLGYAPVNSQHSSAFHTATVREEGVGVGVHRQFGGDPRVQSSGGLEDFPEGDPT